MGDESRLEIKPMYTVAELAPVVGVSTRSLAAMFRRDGIPMFPSRPTRGSPLRVGYNALNLAWPGLFDSIARAQSQRRGRKDWF